MGSHLLNIFCIIYLFKNLYILQSHSSTCFIHSPLLLKSNFFTFLPMYFLFSFLVYPSSGYNYFHITKLINIHHIISIYNFEGCNYVFSFPFLFLHRHIQRLPFLPSNLFSLFQIKFFLSFTGPSSADQYVFSERVTKLVMLTLN